MADSRVALIVGPRMIERKWAALSGFVSSGSAPEEELQKMLKNIPAGDIGKVDDAVGVVKLLLSEEARYVNAANVQLSGAWGL